MFAFNSLLLGVITLLVLARVDFAIATLFQCSVPSHISVSTTNRSEADFYQSFLTVNVPDFGYSVFTYPKSKMITFGVANIDVTFNGIVVYNTPGQIQVPPKPISQTLRNRISGIAQRTEMNYTDSYISDCHIYLLPTGRNRLIVSDKIANEIRRLAESCIQAATCLKIGKMNTLYMAGPTNHNGLIQLPGLIGSMSYSTLLHGVLPFQNALNTLVDIGLEKLIASLKETKHSKIDLPKIESRFTTTGILFNTKGHFEATNGKFGNLTDLVRNSPTTVSHEGMKFIISSTFAINSAHLRYDYKLKHGMKKARGTISAAIDVVNIEARFTADYTNTPCITTLDRIKVTDFGKITSRFTGVGSLKSLIKNRNWFDKKVLIGISQKIVQQLRNAVQSGNRGLWSFNCERFRP